MNTRIQKLAILAASVAFASLAFASPVVLTWQDNSDNENGSIMEGRLPDGSWEEVARTAENVTELIVDKDTHEAWRVKAFNEWGESGYSNTLEKSLPESPGDSLKVESVTTISESTTKTTTITKYQ